MIYNIENCIEYLEKNLDDHLWFHMPILWSLASLFGPYFFVTSILYKDIH